jgi:ubiquinone/menaquinone biosynthesis C-methylase UbiE
MSPLNTATQSSPIPEARLRERAHATWSSGDFARVGARMVLIGELLCRTAQIHAGGRVLDVAAGSGNAAISAARRGASVTASDFVEELLDSAQARAQIEGLQLATAVADAQELPFDDGSFDVVLSTFGVMFAPDQQRAADELLRVCRPGGRIALANWVPDGLMARNAAIVQEHVRRVRELLGAQVRELRCERRTIDMCARSAMDMVEFNRTWFGPVRTAFGQLDEAGQERLAHDMAATFEGFNRATDGTLVAEAEYLEVVAVRA